MADEKKKEKQDSKQTVKPGKTKSEEVSDVELEKVSGGRTSGVA